MKYFSTFSGIGGFELGKYHGWVKAGICPECDGSGAYYVGGEHDNEPDVQQCQWCDYRQSLLKILARSLTE